LECATEESVNIVGLPTHAVSALNLAVGVAFTLIDLLIESKQPVVFVTVNLTVKLPLPVKLCVGFLRVDVFAFPEFGSPKFHDH
jgi:hypothetical protein